MNLVDQITNEMKEAMKQKNNATLSTLRLLRSAIKNKEIDLQEKLSDDDVIAVIKTQVKQLKESVDAFEAAGRDEMAKSSSKEIEVLEKYLPAQMSDEDLESIVKSTIDSVGATSKADMGKVMGASMKIVAGRADGTRVKDMVGKLLAVLTLVVIGNTVIATDAHAAIELIGDTSMSGSLFEVDMALKVFRVLLLWAGVFAVNSILHGGFHYMVSSMRDNEHITAWKKITTGFVGSVVVIALFSITTVFIEIL